MINYQTLNLKAAAQKLKNKFLIISVMMSLSGSLMMNLLFNSDGELVIDTGFELFYYLLFFFLMIGGIIFYWKFYYSQCKDLIPQKSSRDLFLFLLWIDFKFILKFLLISFIPMFCGILIVAINNPNQSKIPLYMMFAFASSLILLLSGINSQGLAFGQKKISFKKSFSFLKTPYRKPVIVTALLMSVYLAMPELLDLPLGTNYLISILHNLTGAIASVYTIEMARYFKSQELSEVDGESIAPEPK